MGTFIRKYAFGSLMTSSGIVLSLALSACNIGENLFTQSSIGNTPPPVSPPVPQIAMANWVNTSFAEQSGSFKITYRVDLPKFPVTTCADFSCGPAKAVNLVTGLAVSDVGTNSTVAPSDVSNYKMIAAAVRFAPEGIVDARDGATFRANNQLSYEEESSYQVTMEVNVASKKYSASIQKILGGLSATVGQTVQIADQFNFRVEQQAITKLTRLSAFAIGNNMRLSNLAITNVLPPDVIPSLPPVISNCQGAATQSCLIANGTGQQSRTCGASQWSAYSTCMVVSCAANFEMSANTCIPVVAGRLALSRTVKQDGSGDFLSITACANASIPGDNCLVSSGTYAETIKPANSGKAFHPITLKAVAGATVIVDGIDLDRVMFVNAQGFKFKSVTRDVITWQFSQPTVGGTYVNGDLWVQGPVTISSFKTMPLETFNFTISRPCTVVGAQVQVPIDWAPGTFLPGLYNCAYVGQWQTGAYMEQKIPSTNNDSGGSMLNLNPRWQAAQGLSKWGDIWNNGDIPYDSALNLALHMPINIAVSSSQPVQSLFSTAESGTAKARFSHAAVLTVVLNPPASGDFRPSYSGPSKTTSAFNLSQINWGLLKSLAPPAGAHLPDAEFLINNLRFTSVEKNGGYGGEPSTQFKSSSNPLMAYGREVGYQTSDAALFLQTNANNEDKAAVLVLLVQYGLDIYANVRNGQEWFGNGGHNHGRLLPLYMSTRLLGLGDQFLKDNLGKFQEIMQHDYVSDPMGKTIPEWHSNGGDVAIYDDWDIGYRNINGSINSASMLTMIFMEGNRANVKARLGAAPGSKGAALVDYIIDVFFPIDSGNPNAAIRFEIPTSQGGVGFATNKIRPFTAEMWHAYPPQ